MAKLKYEKARTTLIAIGSFLILLLIVVFPQRSFQAALNGLDVWLRIVFPALLPFFIASEIMTGTGIVDFFSTLLNPLMRPLFRCPGYSSFIWIMSVTSGYPMGAKLVSTFIEKGKLTRVEGQRILAFCSTSGPLFMMGAVGVGMLGSPQAGKIIAISHYAAALILGFIFRYYGPTEINTRAPYEGSSLSSALKQIYIARKKDGRPYGQLMGDSVRNSINTLFIIGGFIILFSVLIDLFNEINLINHIAHVVKIFMTPFYANTELSKSIGAGILEVTVGCKILSSTMVPMYYKVVGAAFLIGWSGFSIHCQVASILSKTGISTGLYLFTKLSHGLLSALIAWVLSFGFYQGDVPVFSQVSTIYALSWTKVLKASLELLVIVMVILSGLVLLSVAFAWLRSRMVNKKPVKRY